MPDIENAAQFIRELNTNANNRPVTSTLLTGEQYDRNGNRRLNWLATVDARDLLVLRRNQERERYRNPNYGKIYDFELLTDNTNFSTIDSALTRAAERNRFR